MKDDQPQIPPPKARSMRKLVSKGQRALQALRSAEAQRREAYKQELIEAERKAKGEEAELRLAARERLRKLESRVARRLGRLVLGAIRRQGLTGALLTAADLSACSDRDREELALLLAPQTEPTVAIDIKPLPSPLSSGAVDIDLDN